MVVGPRHSVSVAAAVISDDSRVLAIQRRDNGHWEPPGGVLELDEGPLEGLRREVLEETGISIEPVALTGVYKNLSRGIVALVFRSRAVAGIPCTSEEVANIAWLERHQIIERMSEAFAIRLTDALDYDGVPAVRTHNGRVLTHGDAKGKAWTS